MADPTPFPAPKNEEKSHSGFFSKHPAAAPATSLNELSLQMSSLSRRMRLLEERYTTLRKKTQLSDQNMLGVQKDLHRNTTTLGEEMTDLRKEFLELRDTVRLIIKELKDCAKTDDVKVLESYINLWDPIKFATKDEIVRIVEETLDERLGEKLADEPQKL